jgi:hypothetical protein
MFPKLRGLPRGCFRHGTTRQAHLPRKRRGGDQAVVHSQSVTVNLWVIAHKFPARPAVRSGPARLLRGHLGELGADLGYPSRARL